jgi:hypothetical protein
MELMSFAEVSSSLKKKNRAMSLLLGNGFSMSYDSNIFSYNALYTFLSSQEDELLNKLFGVIKTKNFELIMQQLDMTIALLEAFGFRRGPSGANTIGQSEAEKRTTEVRKGTSP